MPVPARGCALAGRDRRARGRCHPRSRSARRRCWCAAWGAARSAAIWRPRCSVTASPAARHGARLRAPSWATPDAVVAAAPATRATRRRRLPVTRPRGRSAPRALPSRPAAASPSARLDGVPVIGMPSGLQPRAAVAYMLVASLEVAASPASRPADSHRDRRRRGCAREELAGEWGADADDDNMAKAIAEQAQGACVCVLRRRADGARPPIAGRRQINENAKLPAFVGRAAGGRPQRDRRLGGRRRRSGKFVRMFLADTDQHPRTRQPDRADRDADRPRAPPPRSCRDRGAARRRPAAVARAARRPGLDLHRRAARRRPQRRSSG